MDVKLVMFKANGQRLDFTVGPRGTRIGRSSQCKIQIPLPEVSRTHCVISVKEEKLILRDMGSSNGTFVNDHAVEEISLRAGDRLAVGPVIFTVMMDGHPKNIKPIRSILPPPTSYSEHNHQNLADSQASNYDAIRMDDEIESPQASDDSQELFLDIGDLTPGKE